MEIVSTAFLHFTPFQGGAVLASRLLAAARMSSRLLALLGVCTGLRVLPNILHSLSAAPSCTAVCLEDWELDSDAACRSPSRSIGRGTTAILASTKANPPPPPSDYEALKQALATRLCSRTRVGVRLVSRGSSTT